MSQRDSGYQRKERDAYETPEWVTEALIPHLPAKIDGWVWEPAAGTGKMAVVLGRSRIGRGIIATDINRGDDFLKNECLPKEEGCRAIITNPPYAHADEFIQRALFLMNPLGLIAMLLRTDFDHAKGRRTIFADHPAFAKKLVLTRRIQWFEDSKGSPSFNHAWFIWDWRHRGPPTLAYGP